MAKKSLIVYIGLFCIFFIPVISEAQPLLTPDVVVPKIGKRFSTPMGLFYHEWYGSGEPRFETNLVKYNEVALRFTAGVNRKFVVDLPTLTPEANLYVDIQFNNPGHGDTCAIPVAQNITLEDFSGGSYALEYVSNCVGNNGNAISAIGYLTLKRDCEFSAVRFTITYDHSVPDELKPYVLTEAQIRFSCPTSNPFATIVLEGCSAGPPPMDFNGDCVVDKKDLGIFLSHWLETNLAF
ncbi:MAG: hypothetical protein ACYTDW_03935 [Planctomycetota bacterium]|jgi:hypothetical protein